MSPSSLLRAIALGAGTATLALAFTAAPALNLSSVSSPASATAASVPQCVPGYAPLPNLTGSTTATTDSDVSVYAAGDFTVGAGASEGEGTYVIGGDASFQGGYFNLGVVGSGSGVTPPAGSDMLVTGGDVTVTSGFLEVAHGVGGNISSGGTVSPRDSISTNGGSITEKKFAPLAPYPSTPARYSALSADAAATEPTGEVVSTGHDVTFTGDDESDVQVFSVRGDELGSLGATKTMVFEDIPDTAVVIVNVTGSTSVLSANTFELNGESIVPSSSTSQTFSRFTQSLVWNFPQSASVTLGDGDQLLGSVLVPRTGSELALLTSINGRIYSGGDITFGGGSQTGLELHNYSIRQPEGCAPTTGSISIDKKLDDPDGTVDRDRVYTGQYTCRDGGSATVASGTWSVTVDGAPVVIANLPIGATCWVTENPLTSAPSDSDDSYRWNTPKVSPSTASVTGSATPAEFTVTNSVDRSVGDLAVRKVVDDPDSVVDTGRQYTGTFACEYNGTDVTPASNTWSVTAGGNATTIATGLPEGTECSVTEDELTEPPLADSAKYGWADPLYSAASVTVDRNSTATVVVTNVVGMVADDETPPPHDDQTPPNHDTGSGDDSGVSPTATDNTAALAATGLELGGPLVIGGSALVFGAVLLLVARRRSLRKRA